MARRLVLNASVCVCVCVCVCAYVCDCVCGWGSDFTAANISAMFVGVWGRGGNISSVGVGGGGVGAISGGGVGGWHQRCVGWGWGVGGGNISGGCVCVWGDISGGGALGGRWVGGVTCFCAPCPVSAPLSPYPPPPLPPSPLSAPLPHHSTHAHAHPFSLTPPPTHRHVWLLLLQGPHPQL